jgi:hypothetical protein
MNFKIDRISAKEVDFNQFVEKYLKPECPVIISGVKLPGNEKWSKEKVQKHFENNDNKEFGWYSFTDDEVLMPDIVSKCFKLKEYAKRKMSMRVFMQPAGHKTLTHYDGNSIHGLNLQVNGEKDWVLISPITPLRCIPFMYVAMAGEINELPSNTIGTKFRTMPGDLVFVPRYWQHQVDSLDSVNINFSWVFTPRFPSQSILGIRESEIIFLRQKFPIVNKAFFPDSIENYGGEGDSIIRNYTKNLSLIKGGIRFIKEISNYFILPLYFKFLKRRGEMLKNNNFNV